MCAQLKRYGGRVLHCTRHRVLREGNRVVILHYAQRENGHGEQLLCSTEVSNGETD